MGATARGVYRRFPRARTKATAEALARLRQLTGGYVPPADACATFRSLYHGLAELEKALHEHIHLENNVLFPRATLLEGELSIAV